jgi:hypothetical protein
MVVPVAVVLRVPVTVVDVVDVIAVGDGLVPAVLAVLVFVALVRGVGAGLALVPVAVVLRVQMPLVRVVDVVAVRHRRVAAALAVGVLVDGVFPVESGHGVRLAGNARIIPVWNRCAYSCDLREEYVG